MCDPVTLLEKAIRAREDGWPLPDDVEEQLSSALAEHVRTGKRLDEILGLSGGKGRNARTKLKERFRNEHLREAYRMIPGTDEKERVDALMYDIAEFIMTKAEDYAEHGVDEDADEYEIAIARAVLEVKGRLPKSRQQYERILNIG